MIEIIDLLQSGNFYGGGKYIEFAKGKYEMDYSFKATKEKIKRIWLSKKQ